MKQENRILSVSLFLAASIYAVPKATAAISCADLGFVSGAPKTIAEKTVSSLPSNELPKVLIHRSSEAGLITVIKDEFPRVKISRNSSGEWSTIDFSKYIKISDRPIRLINLQLAGNGKFLLASVDGRLLLLEINRIDGPDFKPIEIMSDVNPSANIVTSKDRLAVLDLQGIRVFDIANSEPKQLVQIDRGFSTGLSPFFSHDGKTFTYAVNGSHYRSVDLETKAARDLEGSFLEVKLATGSPTTTRPETQLNVSIDSRDFQAASEKGRIVLHDMTGKGRKLTVEIAVDPSKISQKMLKAVGLDKTTDLDFQKQYWSPNGRFVFITVKGGFLLIDTAKIKGEAVVKAGGRHDAIIATQAYDAFAPAFSKNSKTIVVQSYDPKNTRNAIILAYDLGTGKLLRSEAIEIFASTDPVSGRTVDTQRAVLNDLTLSDSGDFLAIPVNIARRFKTNNGAKEDTLNIIDLRTDTLKHTLAFADGVNYAIFSPDQRFVYVRAGNRETPNGIRPVSDDAVYDMATGNPVVQVSAGLKMPRFIDGKLMGWRSVQTLEGSTLMSHFEVVELALP